MAIKETYRGNTNLKGSGVVIEYTKEDIEEYLRCAKDPIHFINNHCKVVHIDKGVVPFKLWPYQEDMVRHFHGMDSNGVVHPDWRFSLTLASRQLGKTVTSAAYILWFTLFNSDKTSVILGNKASLAREILDRIKLMYEYLPKWMKPGIVEWNKGRIKLENNSQIITGATSASAGRGLSIALLYLDELSFVNRSIVEEFWTSTYPTISSGNESKVLISTTPNGYDFFYKLWKESEEGINEFRRIKFDWKSHPERDEKWMTTQVKNIGEEKFKQEFEAEFLGASATLIKSSVLYSLKKQIPKYPVPSNHSIKQYAEPAKEHLYVVTVDTSRGKGLDYSAFTVIDITSAPYSVVCTYRDANIQPMVYPEIIMKIAQMYHNAFVLIEINDLGQQVADILFYDLEYENVYMSVKDDIKEGGASGKRAPGMRTTKKTKSVGCAMLRDLVENNKIEINDEDTLSELSSFVRVGASYRAEDTKHDDLVMCLVMFGYLTTQPVFKDLFDYSLREKLFAEQLAEIDDQMLPLGFFDRGDVEDVPVTYHRGWTEGKDDNFQF
jgi:Terminase RNaseH-like domain/Terminase large subunit, T4likevirus-type, N-terminal